MDSVIRRTLILDFDGTVCVGDGPVRAYARAVAGRHPSLADLEERVARFCTGDAAAEFDGALDGYLAVAHAAGRAGVSMTALQEAFLGARRELAETGLETTTPAGLPQLIDELRSSGARVLLVTNAPAAGIDRMLVHLGLDGRFDSVVAEAGKPDGLGPILDDLGHAVTRESVLSIGDIFVNDLSVPALRGASTALIDPYGLGVGDPDRRVTRFEELTPWIRSWAGLPGA
ncbi:MAG: HAD family hydrolase [Microbacterium sp.]